MTFSLLYSLAVANDVATDVRSTGESLVANFLPIILIIAIFYFLLLRPQQKRAKEHQNMINELAEGTKVVTGGGILGVIKEAKSGEKFITVEVDHNVKLKIKRDTILELVQGDSKVAKDVSNKSSAAAPSKEAEKKPKKDKKNHPIPENKSSRKTDSKNVKK